MTDEAMAAPFGPAEKDRAHYRLSVKCRDGGESNGSAYLYMVAGDGSAKEVTALPIDWKRLADAAERDWNPRLENQGHRPGRMPKRVGDVAMHAQFGRELHVLAVAASSWQEMEEMIRLWSEATPAWRLALWREIEEHTTTAFTNMPDICGASVPQIVQEALRKRAADGSVDLHRVDQVEAPRRAAMAKIKAARKASLEWRKATTRKVIWKPR